MSSPISRRQRRKERRMKEIEDRYLPEIVERQERIDEIIVEQFYIAAGWALYSEYGWKAKGIGRVWEAMNQVIYNYKNDRQTFYDVRRKLKEACGLEIRWKE